MFTEDIQCDHSRMRGFTQLSVFIFQPGEFDEHPASYGIDVNFSHPHLGHGSLTTLLDAIDAHPLINRIKHEKSRDGFAKLGEIASWEIEDARVSGKSGGGVLPFLMGTENASN